MDFSYYQHLLKLNVLSLLNPSPFERNLKTEKIKQGLEIFWNKLEGKRRVKQKNEEQNHSLLWKIQYCNKFC